MLSYRDSTAYQRSNGARPDGRPRWPLTVEDRPSLTDAHANAAARSALLDLERRVSAARAVA